MTTNRARGNAYERYLIKRSEAIGFIDVERQPLSGQLFQAKYKSDVKLSAITPDERRLDFIASCKKTLNRDKIQFAVDWLTENEEYGRNMGRIPILSFSLGGKPGQKLSVHIVISNEEFVKITGNIRELNIQDLKFRGKKYMTMTREKLDKCRHRVGARDKIYVCSIFPGKEYFIFELEDFYQAIMTEYREINDVNRWY